VEKMLLHNNEWNPELMEEAGITTDEVENIGRLMFEYHDSFRDCYTHKNQIVFGETYLMGLMSNLDRKSVEPISLQYLDVNDVRGFQRFFKDSPWNFKKMKDIYQMRLSSLITDPDAMLTLDPSDFPKKGKESAGVARQHCGALGKTDNCQCGVFIGYTSTKGYGLVDSKLYMPEKWFGDEYKDRRDNCAVPKDLKFETKIEIAQELIKDIKDKGYFPSKWLGCDSFFGRNAAFLDSIADDFWYFADVLSNMLVFTIDTKTEPYEYSGRGRPPRKELKPSIKPISVSSIAKDDSIPWNTVILGEGAKGPIIAEIKCLRVFELRDGLPEREIWLYIRKSEDGKIKYSLSNAPDDTPLKDLNRASLMRWPIEQCFEECKSNLGMDHYEIRSYPGWHRHMLFVFLAQLFLLELRFKFKKKSYFNSFDDKKACSSSIDIKDS
jgi:SRSO17 transposase